MAGTKAKRTAHRTKHASFAPEWLRTRAAVWLSQEPQRNSGTGGAPRVSTGAPRVSTVNE